MKQLLVTLMAVTFIWIPSWAREPLETTPASAKSTDVPQPKAGENTDKDAYDGIKGLLYTTKEIRALPQRVPSGDGSYVLRTHFYAYHDKLPKSFLRKPPEKKPQDYNAEKKTPFRFEVSVDNLSHQNNRIMMTPIMEGKCDIYIVDVEKKKLIAYNRSQTLTELCVVCGHDGYVGEVPNGTYDVIVVCQMRTGIRMGQVLRQTFSGVENATPKKTKK